MCYNLFKGSGVMQCPKCNTKMARGFCIRCGYIDEETKMRDHQINFEKSDLEKYLKRDYVKVLYNQNKISVFILGPLYFAYRDHFYLSFILGILDVLSAYFMGYFFQSMPIFITSFIINHMLYVMFANAFYMYLVNRKIIKLKKRYPDSYIDIINNKKSKYFFLPFLTILCYIVLFIFILFLYNS